MFAFRVKVVRHSFNFYCEVLLILVCVALVFESLTAASTNYSPIDIFPKQSVIARRLPIGPKPFLTEVMLKVLLFGVAFFRIVKSLTERLRISI